MRLWFFLWLLLAIGAGCARSGSSENGAGDPAPAPGETRLVPVTLQLNWYPEVEHGGYYAALVEGYYREVGLDVTIRSGGPNTPVVQEVALGRVAFGVANADDVLFARAQDASVVAVMAPMQTSPRCLIVHERSGIKKFDELANLTLAVRPGAAFAEYLRLKVPLQGVRTVPYPGSVQQFLHSENYAQQGYVFSEPYLAREKGGDPHVLMLADLGYNPYTSLLITRSQEIDKRPDVVRRMVAASVRGWTEYLDHPAATNERIHKLNPEIDPGALEYGADAIKPLVRAADSAAVGSMTLERWRTLAEQLVESKQLAAGAVDPKQAFSTEFLPAGDP